MPIRADRDRTQQIAVCACDDCGTTSTMPAKHARPGRVIGHAGRPKMQVLSEGDVIAKLRKQGWSYNRKGLLCPECATAKALAKTSKPQPKESVIVNKLPKIDDPAVRQPTREQRRQIVDLLGTCYDTKAERYIGTDTDKTVADCIGGGVLFGWVAQVREEFFGPDGGNDELESILADIAAQIDLEQARTASLKTLMEQAAPIFHASQATIQELETIRSRVLALKRSLGAKGSRA